MDSLKETFISKCPVWNIAYFLIFEAKRAQTHTLCVKYVNREYQGYMLAITTYSWLT